MRDGDRPRGKLRAPGSMHGPPCALGDACTGNCAGVEWSAQETVRSGRCLHGQLCESCLGRLVGCARGRMNAWATLRASLERVVGCAHRRSNAWATVRSVFRRVRALLAGLGRMGNCADGPCGLGSAVSGDACMGNCAGSPFRDEFIGGQPAMNASRARRTSQRLKPFGSGAACDARYARATLLNAHRTATCSLRRRLRQRARFEHRETGTLEVARSSRGKPRDERARRDSGQPDRDARAPRIGGPSLGGRGSR